MRAESQSVSTGKSEAAHAELVARARRRLADGWLRIHGATHAIRERRRLDRRLRAICLAAWTSTELDGLIFLGATAKRLPGGGLELPRVPLASSGDRVRQSSWVKLLKTSRDAAEMLSYFAEVVEQTCVIIEHAAGADLFDRYGVDDRLAVASLLAREVDLDLSPA